jgi:hypothetical protein
VEDGHGQDPPEFAWADPPPFVIGGDPWPQPDPESVLPVLVLPVDDVDEVDVPAAALVPAPDARPAAMAIVAATPAAAIPPVTAVMRCRPLSRALVSLLMDRLWAPGLGGC